MPSDTRYTDEQVEAQAADREAWGQTDAAAMLRALLADRRRAECEMRHRRLTSGGVAGMMQTLDCHDHHTHHPRIAPPLLVSKGHRPAVQPSGGGECCAERGAMSFQLMRAVWFRRGLTSSQKFILLALADWSSTGGTNMFPAMRTLAEKCEMSERQARRVVVELENMGMLVVRRGKGPGGTNRYEINLSVLMDRDTTVKMNPPKHDVTPPGHHVRPTPDTMSANPVSSSCQISKDKRQARDSNQRRLSPLAEIERLRKYRAPHPCFSPIGRSVERAARRLGA